MERPIYIQRTGGDWIQKDNERRLAQSKRQRDGDELFLEQYAQVYAQFKNDLPFHKPTNLLELRVWNDIKTEQLRQAEQRPFDYEAYEAKEAELSVFNPKNKFSNGSIIGDGNQIVFGDVHNHNHHYYK